MCPFFSQIYLRFSIFLVAIFFNDRFLCKFQIFLLSMPPKGKDNAWAHCDVIDGKMICKFFQKIYWRRGYLRLRQHLAGIRSRAKPCDATKEVIGSVSENTLPSLRSLRRIRLRGTLSKKNLQGRRNFYKP